MSQGDQHFYGGFRFLSHEANSAFQALRAQYEVRLIETRRAIEHDGWVTTDSGRMISHAAQLRLVDVLIEMVETLYESAAQAYFCSVGSSEYKARVDFVGQQLLGYCLERWARLTGDLPLEPVGFDPAAGAVCKSNEKLLSDTLTAHLTSKALQLELQMWQAEASPKPADLSTVKLDSQAGPVGTDSTAERQDADPARLTASPPQGIAGGPTADQARLLAKVEEILKPHYAQLATDQDETMAGRTIRGSAAEWAATAGARRIRAYEWAGQALLNVLTHHEVVPMEPGRFDLLQNGLVRRLAEDAADHFSMSGIPGASNYHDEIRARLLETLPQMAERPKAVNSRRYLGDAETSAVERTDNTRTRVEDPSRLTASPPQGIAKGAMPDNPFSDPEINDQIRAKVRRLQAASLEWDDNPDGRSFDDFRVETLVENLDAHAEPYLCKVDSEDLISQYGEYMRGVGSALIRNAEQRSFLSDPYGEARLREMAENSGSLMNRILFLKPGERESEVQSEVERLRAEFMPKAVAWHQWRSQMRSRIEARFEARYRRWEADAIERLRNRGVASGAVGRSKNLESLKASIDEDIQALVKQQRSTLTWEQQMMGASPPPRTFNLNDPFEANLFSVLERGAPELTESAVAEAVQQDGDEALRPAKRSAITEQIYPFIEDRWLNTGFDPLHGAPGMAFRAGPTLNRLREVLDRTLQDFSPKPERAGDAGPKAVKTASAQRHQATISNPKGPGRKRGPKPDYKTVPRVAEKPFNHAGVAKAARAKTVARIIHELDQLKPQMFEDESEYNRLRAQHPDFLTFKIAERRPDLKTKVLAIQGSTRHIRLAQELAAAHHGRQLSTIRDDWKDFKPKQFKRSR